MVMPRHGAKDNDCCPECGARFIAAPCRLCKGTGQSLLLFKCRGCGGTGKKMVCPNFLSHLRAQSGSQTSSPKRPAKMQ
jgi:RecJ-like exonuclease